MATLLAYTKLGQSEPNGILHAAKTETLGNWEGPEAHCGATLKTTVTRNRMDANLACNGCREALGLRPKQQRQASGLNYGQRYR